MQPVGASAKRYDLMTMFFHRATAVLVVAQWLGAHTVDLHAGAALVHRYLWHDGVLGRMLPQG